MEARTRPYRGGRVRQDRDDDAQAAERASSDGSCVAHGCTMPGSLDIGSTGRSCCPAHAWSLPERWQDITRALHEHQWLRDLIVELCKPHCGQAWRAAATRFWEPDTDHAILAPADFETRELYAYRMHLELMWRVGARSRRPDPMRPQRDVFGVKALAVGNIGAAIAA